MPSMTSNRLDSTVAATRARSRTKCGPPSIHHNVLRPSCSRSNHRGYWSSPLSTPSTRSSCLRSSSMSFPHNARLYRPHPPLISRASPCTPLYSRHEAPAGSPRDLRARLAPVLHTWQRLILRYAPGIGFL